MSHSSSDCSEYQTQEHTDFSDTQTISSHGSQSSVEAAGGGGVLDGGKSGRAEERKQETEQLIGDGHDREGAREPTNEESDDGYWNDVVFAKNQVDH